MNKLEELKTVKSLVLFLLETDKKTRNSDSYLYLQVLNFQAKEKGIDLDGLTVPFFLANVSALGLANFETVRRTRQIAQAERPELAAKEEVEAYRAENETAYRAFARGAV